MRMNLELILGESEWEREGITVQGCFRNHSAHEMSVTVRVD